MFVITGATGQLGRKIVENLVTLVSAEHIAVSVRDPDKATDLEKAGVRVRQGDYDDAASLRYAWQGATRLLLVSSNAAARGDDPLAQHAAAIAVAHELGVERIFYTSQMASSPHSHFPPARTHAATEQMLAQSGLAWTALRHGFYAESALAMNARGFASSTLAAPQDGKVAWTTHDDLAEADARLLLGNEPYDGPTPPLTGTEALDLAELTQIAQEIVGKPVVRQFLEVEQMIEAAMTSGVPQERIEIMVGYCRAARHGEFAQVDPTLARLLGRSPQSMRAFMAKRLAI